MILYLHGFRSSPDSSKARQLAAALQGLGLARAWHCPQLPASPAQALRLALSLAQTADPADPQGLTLIGSSLGGFYATWLAERLGCRAVLLNPVVHAARDLATQVGAHRSFHDDQPFVFLPEHVDELARAEADIPVLSRPGRYFLLAATGDEVLDWREMQARYAGSRQRIIQGSDHGLSDFERWLPEVLEFALAPTADRRSTASGLHVVTGSWEALGPAANRIRTQVFVEEQQVPPELELDALDAQCLHALALDADGQAVGTGRLLPDGHVGRMAVLRPWRGRGVGSRLLLALVEAARARGDAEVVLAAQCHAQDFYARHGFVAEGETFMDAGIPHVLMRRALAG